MIKLGTTDIKDIRLGTTPVKKIMLGDKVVWEKVEGIRFIRDWCNSGVNGGQPSWAEIQVYGKTRQNLALNKLPAIVYGSEDRNWSQGLNVITNGNTSVNQVFVGNGLCCVQIDLVLIYELSMIKIYRETWPGSYKDTKTEVSADGINWKTVFDSAVSGTYKETAEGHTINLT